MKPTRPFEQYEVVEAAARVVAKRPAKAVVFLCPDEENGTHVADAFAQLLTTDPKRPVVPIRCVAGGHFTTIPFQIALRATPPRVMLKSWMSVCLDDVEQRFDQCGSPLIFENAHHLGHDAMELLAMHGRSFPSQPVVMTGRLSLLDLLGVYGGEFLCKGPLGFDAYCRRGRLGKARLDDVR